MVDVLFAAGYEGSHTISLIGSSDGVSFHAIPNPNDDAGNEASGIAGDGHGHYVLAGGGDLSSPTRTLSHSSDGGVTFSSDAPPTETGPDFEAFCSVWAPAPLNLWVAGDFLGQIATSPDGISWTIRSSAFNPDPTPGGFVSQIAYNGSLLVAGGYNSDDTATIMHSPDAVTWTLATDQPFLGWDCNGVFWDGVNWIATGSDQEAGTICVATSTDGDTWTPRATPYTVGTGGSDCWGQSVVGNGSLLAMIGTPLIYPGPVICTSTDHGATWTAQTTPFDPTLSTVTFTPNAITYAPSLSLFVCSFNNDGSTTEQLATSPDAITWTLISTPYDVSGGAVGLNAPMALTGTFITLGPVSLTATGTNSGIPHPTPHYATTILTGDK